MSKNRFTWLIEKLEEDSKIESADVLSDNLLQVIRKDGYTCTVTMSTILKYNTVSITKILDENNADFILHTNKDAYVSGTVYDMLHGQRKVIGSYGDFFRAIRQERIWPYVPKDVEFIMRGIGQHTRVERIRRLDNKRFEIERRGLDTVTIIALNDYDLGVESIRQAVDQFPHFDAVLKSNPNGRISSSAIELADSREIKAFKWGEMLGELNKRWDWKK